MDRELVELLDSRLGCNGHTLEENRITFDVFSRETTVRCPYCGAESSKVHSSYIRSIEDLPIQDHQAILRLKTRKMFCTNPDCGHKTFSEVFEFVESKGRKTKRLLKRILEVSIKLSSVDSASTLKREHIIVGKSTICELIKKNANPDAE